MQKKPGLPSRVLCNSYQRNQDWKGNLRAVTLRANSHKGASFHRWREKKLRGMTWLYHRLQVPLKFLTLGTCQIPNTKARDSLSLVVISESINKWRVWGQPRPIRAPWDLQGSKDDGVNMDLHKLHQPKCSQPDMAVVVCCLLLETGCWQIWEWSRIRQTPERGKILLDEHNNYMQILTTKLEKLRCFIRNIWMIFDVS